MATLSPVLGRVLAVAILVAVLAGLWLLVVAPVRAKLDGYDLAIGESRTLLARYQRIAAGRDQLRSRLEELRLGDSAGGFLKGARTELVAAELQNRVGKLVEASGGESKSMQILPGDTEQGFAKISIRVAMIANTEAVQTIFYALETANPYLFLDNIDVRAHRRRAETGRTRGADNLQVRFDVFGYMPVERP